MSDTVIASDLAERLGELQDRYQELVGSGLALDLTRGKPAPEQLALSDGLLALPGEGNHRSADGTDTRNYGGLTGLRELREIFAPSLQVPVGQLVAMGNASLSLMFDCLSDSLLQGVPGGSGPWRDQGRIAMIASVPGYDRHFTICAGLGIDLLPVPMTPDGPDLDVVESLVADPSVKGIWSVPRYSNPSGVTYAAQTVRRLAAMPTAAPDFRIYWDNAYAVHHLTTSPQPLADLLSACATAGNDDRAFVFGSTSKVTFAGAGVAFFGSSPANVAWLLANAQRRTIGPDKVNQLRHALFLRDEAGLSALMNQHRALLAPKFAQVELALEDLLGGTGVATWSRPEGGYFVSLDVMDGCARRVVELAAGAGIALTPAGAPFPGGDDPNDRTLRLAPSFPSVDEVAVAMRGVALCVLLAAAEQLSNR